MKILYVLVFTGVLFMPSRADATKAPASGEIYSLAASSQVNALSSESGVTLSLVDDKGAKKIKADFTDLKGYPGLNFIPPQGGWDFSDFDGVQMEVTNKGSEVITVNIKVENDGDWKISPWSVDMITVAPGDTQMLRVKFGEAFGHPGYKLDPAHITNVRFFISPPKNPVSLLLGAPRLFKGPPSTAVETPAPDAAPPPPTVYGPPAVPKAEPVVPVFAATPLLDVTGKHDLPNTAHVSDEAAPQLKGLASLAEFQALPEADRHVYSFDPAPGREDSLTAQKLDLNLNLGTEGVTNQKVAFLPDGFFPLKDHTFVREKNPATGCYEIKGIGQLDWGAKVAQTFNFNPPLLGFGVVVRSSGDMELRRFFWGGADINGFPISCTLADGTVVQLGKRDLRGALIKGNTDAFIGVIDHSGRGIVSITYTLGGLAGNVSQSLTLSDLVFTTLPKPASAPIISLKGSYDFASPEAIAVTPRQPLEGMASLDDFRFIVADHRFVYDFSTWPQAKPELNSKTGVFSFDLKGNGKIGEKVTVTATNAADNAKLSQATVKSDDNTIHHSLSGLGDIGKGAWAEQTFKFDKPVWGFGVTYRSPNEVQLARTGEGATFPVSYTLSDGTVVNLGQSGVSGGVLSANGNTFVGVIDKMDKGISSVTVRLQGTAPDTQPVSIENLAFALAGPPPGTWKLTMHDEFNGDKLNPNYWSFGYTFPDVINNELEGFVPENTVVANGVATIKVEKRDCVNTDQTGRKGGTQHFASSNFTSYGKFTQTYGYFEARIKMPHARGAGVWPAFWMLPDRGKDYPDVRGSYKTADFGMGSEIDLFEFMPRWKRLDCLFPIHVGTIWSYGKETPEDPAPHGYGSYALDNNGWGPEELYYPNADTEFHTYGLYWSPERLIFYVDSKPIFRVRDTKNIPNIPEYFLFNISLSENGWGKDPSNSHPTYAEIVGDMPNEMQIDYFRAYSGVLDEAVPPSPSDIPGVHDYRLPPPRVAASAPPKPTATEAANTAAPQSSEVPAAPINSTITTPAQ